MLGMKQRFPIPGTPPATLLKRVEGDGQPAEFCVVEYAADFYEEHRYSKVEDLPATAAAGRKRWIEMNGLSDPEALRAFGAKFNLHPLALEDTLNTGQRAKAELYDKHLF